MPTLVSRGARRRTINEINMVPFIDVMLVLLIIFMVTAPLIAPSMIDLPSVGKAAQQPDRVIQVLIGKDEKLRLQTQDAQAQPQSVSHKDLVAQIQRLQSQSAANGNAKGAASGATASTNTAVVISADRSVRYETVVRVMDQLQRAGIARVGLSVQITP